MSSPKEEGTVRKRPQRMPLQSTSDSKCRCRATARSATHPRSDAGRGDSAEAPGDAVHEALAHYGEVIGPTRARLRTTRT